MRWKVARTGNANRGLEWFLRLRKIVNNQTIQGFFKGIPCVLSVGFASSQTCILTWRSWWKPAVFLNLSESDLTNLLPEISALINHLELGRWLIGTYPEKRWSLILKTPPGRRWG